MPKNQMRPIPGANIVEHSEQETNEQEDDSCINGKTKDRQDFINRADPRRLKMETEILLDQVSFKAKNAAVEITKDRCRCTTIGYQQSEAGHSFKYDSS